MQLIKDVVSLFMLGVWGAITFIDILGSLVK